MIAKWDSRLWWIILLCAVLLACGVAAGVAGAASADAPVAEDDRFTTMENRKLAIKAPGVLRNDEVASGTSAVRLAKPRHGKLTLNGDGSFVYAPDRGYSGKESFTYKLDDGAGGVDEATVRILVRGATNAPVARDDNYRVGEDGTLTVPVRGVLKNDTGDRVFTRGIASPRHGTLDLNRNGSFVYTPDADYDGKDYFTYRNTRGDVRSNAATVIITVDPVNDAPFFTEAASNTSQTIDEGANLTALEATDVDGDDLTFERTGGSLPPGVTLEDDGGFAGAAGGRAAGDYTANIKVSDGDGESATTELEVTVNQVDVASVADDADVSTDEDTAKTITLSATDADTDNLAVAVASNPSHGTLGAVSTPNCSTLEGTATCTATVLYTPDADYNGPDSFTFTAGDSAPATVHITVNPVNDAPVANDDTKSTPENTPLVFPAADLVANDSEGAANEDGQTLTVTEVRDAQHGTVLLENGEITFTPDADYNGPASFDYTVCDDGSPQKCSTQTAKVNVIVSPVNSAPVAQNDSRTMDEDGGPIQLDLGPLVSDVETSDANLVYTIVSGPTAQQGNLSGNGPTFDFDPAGDFNGTVEISYKVTDRGDPDNCGAPGAGCDAAKESGTRTVTITIDPVNDPPANISLSPSSVDENEPSGTLVGILSSADPDAGDTHSYALVTGAGSDDNGQFQISNDRLETAAQFDRETKSSYTIRVRSTDSASEAFEKQFTITVGNVNESPTDITLSPSSVDENEPSGTDVGPLATTDPDSGDTFTYTLVAGTGDDDNADFQVTGSTLKTSETFDYETKSSYTVRVRTTDSGNASTEKALTITVNNTNDAPTANDDTGTTDEDTTLNASAPGVLDNDADEDAGDTRTVSKLNGSTTLTGTSDKGATVTINADGSYTYNPGSVFQHLLTGQDDTDTFTYTAKDAGGLESDPATVTITVTGVTDPPRITSGGTLDYTENDPPTPVHGALDVTHPEGAQIAEATVEITGNYQNGEDALAFSDNDAGDDIALEPGGTDQTLTLTGADSAANYQAALRAVTYENTSENPSNLTRTATFTATDVNSTASAPATRDISVTPVDDPPVAVNDSETVLEDADATNVPVLDNDTDVDAGPKTVDSIAVQPTNGTVAITGGGTGLTYKPAANYCNDPPASNLDTFTYRLNGGSPGTVSMTVTCVNDAPVADNETFNGTSRAIGNTSLVINETTDAAPDPTGPQKTVTGDILDGDTDIDGPGPLTVTGAGTDGSNGQTDGGGRITVQPDGDFIYQPESGCADTTDTFKYTVSDGHSPTAGTAQGTVTVSIADCVWYVDDSAPAGGDGRSHSQYQTLASIDGAGGSGDRDSAGDKIFLYDGIYSGGLPLENNQALFTEKHGLVVGDGGTGNLTLEPNDGSGSTLNGGLAAASGNTVQGLNLGTTGSSSVYALSGTSVGSFSMNNVTGGDLNNPAGGAINIGGTGNALNLQFGTLSSSGSSGNAVSILNASGTVSGQSGTLSNATGTTVNLNGGSLDFTLNGAVSDDAGQLISISNKSSGTTDFNGAVDDVTANPNNGGGVSLQSNGTALTRFDGGLNLSTGSSNGLVATSSGTLALPDPAGSATNSIVSTTGTPLNVASTTIHADDLVFEKISSNGSANGIVLNNTGTSGNLSVTGNGGGCTIATPTCSGGTIQSTTSDGISLTNTSSPSFNLVRVLNTAGHGISGTTTSGLSLSNSLVQGAGDADNEAGLFFANVNGTNLTGSASITNTVIHAPADVGAFIQNYGGTLNLTVSGSTISGTQKNTPGVVTGDDLLRIISDRTNAGSATITARIIGSTFKNSESDDILANAQSSTGSGGGTMNLTVDGNTFDGNGVFETCETQGCNSYGIVTQGTQGATIRYTIQNNSIVNHLDSAIAARSDNSSNVQGFIKNNTIGTAGSPRSGSYRDRGIFLASDDSSDFIASVENNVIHSTFFEGISASTTDGTGLSPKMDMTILGNTTPTPADTSGTYLPSINMTSSGNASACARAENNTAQPGRGGAGSIDFLLFRDTATSTATFKLEGLPAPTADASAFVKSKNPASADPVFAVAGKDGSNPTTPQFTGGTCRTPAATPTP